MSNDSSENKAFDCRQKALTEDTGIFGVPNEGSLGSALLVHGSEIVRKDSLINGSRRSYEKRYESIASYENICGVCVCAISCVYSGFCGERQYKSEVSNAFEDCDPIRCSDTSGLDSVICDTLAILPPKRVAPRSRVSSYSMTQDNIDDWLSSLRTQTHDYWPHCEPDDCFPTIKSIPSLNFNCCGLLCSTPYYNTVINSRSLFPLPCKYSSREGQFAVDSVCVNVGSYLVNESSSSNIFTGLSNPRLNLMVERFKQELMERRIKSKRRAIYVKVEENDCSGDGYTTAVPSIKSTNSYNGQPKRNAFHEVNSDFVKDILNAFDNLLRNDFETQTAGSAGLECNALLYNDHKKYDKVNHPYFQKLSGNLTGKFEVEKIALMKELPNEAWRSDSSKQNISAIKYRSMKFLKFGRMLTAIEVSKSLNGFLLTIDNISRQRLPFIISTSIIKSEELESITSVLKVYPTHIYSNSTNEIAAHAQHESHESLDDRIVFPVVEDEDDIYQPIWKFRTVGNPCESILSMVGEGDDLICSKQHDLVAATLRNYSSSSSVKDLSEWETDDEFIYSQNAYYAKSHVSTLHEQNDWDIEKNKSFTNRVPSQLSLAIGEKNLELSLSKSLDSFQSLHSNPSENSIDSAISNFALNSSVSSNTKFDQFMSDRKYEMVCILYSLEDIHLRTMIHCNKNYKRELFPDTHVKNKVISDFYDAKPEISASIEKKPYETQILLAGAEVKLIEKRKMDVIMLPTLQMGDVLPSVQAWKSSLLDPFYLDDEEDEYVSRNEIFKILRDEAQPMALKKCASEGNLLQHPMSRKKTLGERLMNKVQAVGIFPMSPRHEREKKKIGQVIKRRGSVGPFYSNNVKNELLFGASLEQVQISGIAHIPNFVIDCIQFIEQPENICTDGLYRASGNKVEIDALKKKLSERYDLNLFKDQDIHNITGLLKSFFRELKTALISDEVYNKLPHHLLDRESLWLIKEALTLLPDVSQQTLKYLMQHLTRVAAKCDQNRMPASNLAIIWGPCILYSSFTSPMSIARINTLTKVLIEQYKVIFKEGNERLIV